MTLLGASVPLPGAPADGAKPGRIADNFWLTLTGKSADLAPGIINLPDCMVADRMPEFNALVPAIEPSVALGFKKVEGCCGTVAPIVGMLGGGGAARGGMTGAPGTGADAAPAPAAPAPAFLRAKNDACGFCSSPITSVL